jgi:hypothetical protein
MGQYQIQTDGEDLPSAPGVQGDASEHLNALLAFVRKQGIAVEFSEDIAPALGVSCGGKILLAPGYSEAETLATLVHEYAHLCGAEIYVAFAARRT